MSAFKMMHGVALRVPVCVGDGGCASWGGIASLGGVQVGFASWGGKVRVVKLVYSRWGV
jgi:hypothetical protein